LFLIEKRALVDSDITSLLLFAAKLDEYLEYDELIKLRNNKRKFSGSIQQFKSGADALTALFVARSKTMKELLVLMKELNLTPRARAQSKQALVNPNQLPFDFESIRNALNTGSI
jgi:phage terminase small subunit